MSNTQFAFLKRANVPTREAWQGAIDALNFSVRFELDPELEPFEDEGFSPCKIDGSDHDVGFEIFYEPTEDIIEEDDDPLKEFVDDARDYCISMVWRGSMQDCAAVMIASCALVKLSDAVVSCDGEAPDSFDKLVEDTKEMIVEALKERDVAAS